jgi:hypothetical protein
MLIIVRKTNIFYEMILLLKIKKPENSKVFYLQTDALYISLRKHCMVGVLCAVQTLQSTQHTHHHGLDAAIQPHSP